MVDIHSHIIPKIDDGSKNIEETYTLLQEANKVGFTDIISTSHYIEGVYDTNVETRLIWIEKINQIMQENNIKLKIHPGTEIYIIPYILELLKQNKVLTLGNSRYVLFELPMNNNIKCLSEIMIKLLQENYIPIIAHPERYFYIQKDPNLLIPLIERGVMFQANYGSIIGYYGKEVKNTIKKLLSSNMIHFLASDVHKNNTIYTQMEEIKFELEKIIGKEKVNELSTLNPKSILENNNIDIQKPLKVKKWF
ncbi:MAG: hypothetical protein HFJ53_07260 [Clostridia bacterium]|jgi:protein-tyrosine phosphatase|nr:hypothetical protein [Clostridia bacterium]